MVKVLFLFCWKVSFRLYTPIAGVCVALRTLSYQMSFLSLFDWEYFADLVLARGESVRYWPGAGFMVCSMFSGAKRTFLDLPSIMALGGRGLVGLLTGTPYDPGPGLYYAAYDVFRILLSMLYVNYLVFFLVALSVGCIKRLKNCVEKMVWYSLTWLFSGVKSLVETFIWQITN